MKVAYRIVKRSIGRRTRQYSSVDAAAQNRTRGQSGERRSRTEDQGGHVHPARMQSVITQRWHSFPAVILSYCRESYSVGQGFLGEGRSIEYEPPQTIRRKRKGPLARRSSGIPAGGARQRARRRQPSARTTEEMLQVFEASPDLTSDDSLFRRGVLE